MSGHNYVVCRPCHGVLTCKNMSAEPGFSNPAGLFRVADKRRVSYYYDSKAPAFFFFCAV